MIIRELVGELYFGEPKGIGEKDGEKYGFNTLLINKAKLKEF
jgi:3-isopropylmalate dehydrogenase